MLHAPTIISDYEIIEELDEGRWSVVYKARHITTGELVALKLFREPRLAGFAEYLSSAQEASQTNNPTLPRVISSGLTDDERGYLILPLYTGETLEDAVRTKGPLSIEEALALVNCLSLASYELQEETSLALNHVFFHREPQGKTQTILLDVGEHHLTKANQNQTRSGPPVSLSKAAMTSPERLTQSFGKDSGDVYSLGVVWYYALTKELPYPSDSIYQMAYRMMREPFPNVSAKRPELPAAQALILQKMTAQHEAERYQNFSEVGVALAMLLPQNEGRHTKSYFHGKAQTTMSSLTQEAQRRLIDMQQGNSLLRVERDVWYNRLLGLHTREQFWYLHPSYLIGRDKERVEMFSWAYLQEIGRRDGWVSLRFVEDFRRFSTLQKTNELSSPSPGVVRFQYSGSSQDLFEMLSIFVERARSFNFQKQAHLAPEAELFPMMLNWRPA